MKIYRAEFLRISYVIDGVEGAVSLKDCIIQDNEGFDGPWADGVVIDLGGNVLR